MSYLSAVLGVACAVLVYLWQRASSKLASATNAKKRLTEDLVSASEQVKRTEEGIRVLRDELEALSAELSALDPDQYIRAQLRRAGRATNPRSHAPLPAGKAAVDSGGDDRGGDR